MEVMLHATLAGGVAIGTASDLCMIGAFPIIIGGVAGILSALGYLKMNSMFRRKLKLHDTCGVQFLHGIPGLMGGICGAIATANATFYFDNPYAVE
jgi:ammonium transporter Rh